MSAVDITATEITESLTGFDEIAIEKHLGMDIYTDAESKPMLSNRAMVFIYQTRQGKNAAEAKEFAMSLPMKQVMEYFAEDVEEMVPDEPDSESGKEGSQSD